MSTEHPTELTDLDGLGERLEARLHKAGVRTLEDLASVDPGDLLKRLKGVRGFSIERLQRWIDAAKEVGESAERHLASVENLAGDRLESIEVVVDGGHIIVGEPRDVDVMLHTEGLKDRGLEWFSYAASGFARRLGATSWIRLGGCDGSGLISHAVPMRFRSVPVSPGVYRVEVRARISLAPRSEALVGREN